jgi:hypothetical protein
MRTRLGTGKWFVVHKTPGKSTTYTLTVKPTPHSEVVYRVAPESPSKPEAGQKWRVDSVGMFGWEAVTPEVFETPKLAAAFVVSRVG